VRDREHKGTVWTLSYFLEREPSPEQRNFTTHWNSSNNEQRSALELAFKMMKAEVFPESKAKEYVKVYKFTEADEPHRWVGGSKFTHNNLAIGSNNQRRFHDLQERYREFRRSYELSENQRAANKKRQAAADAHGVAIKAVPRTRPDNKERSFHQACGLNRRFLHVLEFADADMKPTIMHLFSKPHVSFFFTTSFAIARKHRELTSIEGDICAFKRMIRFLWANYDMAEYSNDIISMLAFLDHLKAQTQSKIVPRVKMNEVELINDCRLMTAQEHAKLIIINRKMIREVEEKFQNKVISPDERLDMFNVLGTAGVFFTHAMYRADLYRNLPLKSFSAVPSNDPTANGEVRRYLERIEPEKVNRGDRSAVIPQTKAGEEAYDFYYSKVHLPLSERNPYNHLAPPDVLLLNKCGGAITDQELRDTVRLPHSFHCHFWHVVIAYFISLQAII
jgi:hypothetical protein